MSERGEPQSLEAERSVLGSILIDGDAFDMAAGVLNAEHFARVVHRYVWHAMARLRKAGAAIDFGTVRESLSSAGHLDEVGILYLSQLTDGVPKASNIEHYARIVRDKSTLRDLLEQARGIVKEALESPEDVQGLVDSAERRLMAVGKSISRGDFLLADDWMGEMFRHVEAASSNSRDVTGVPTGIAELDRRTRGLQPSDLIYVGARPSVGKTSLALQIALEASKHVMVGFVSVEMSRASVGFRAVSMESRIDALRIMTGKITGYEVTRVTEALNRLSERRLAIDDASGQTAAGVRAKVRRLASRYGCGLVIVDYMQLLHTGQKSENRNQELSQMSASLKDLAKELNAPVMVLSQLSRESEKNAGRRPAIWNLRDSGSLEADADLVLLLHRPGQHEDGQQYREGEEAELIIAKQRNGPTGVIPLVWQGSTMRFVDVAIDRARTA